MVSINYSASGSSALRSLQATSRAMETSQTRIATGLKINGAKDDAMLWQASQAIRSDIKFGEGVQNSLKIAQVQADKTATAAQSIREVLGEMKNIVDAAGVSGADRTGLQADMAAYISQLKSLVASAAVNGANLLTGTAPAAVTIGKDINGAAVTMTLASTDLTLLSAAGTTGAFEVAGTAWDTDTTSAATFTSLLTFNVATAGTGNVSALSTMMTDLNAVIAKVDGVVARVASYSKRLEMQADYMTKIADIQESALSSMVDADLDAESARLSALQVQQQLATTALQIANQSRTNILQLFQ